MTERAPKGRVQAGVVDYSLARKATLSEVAAGRLSRLDVCDAHPDLIRAARFCGEEEGPCPICESGSAVLVRYVFSDDLSKRENGSLWTNDSIEPLFKLHEARLYTVEVCPDCSWNHLRSQLLCGGGPSRVDSDAPPGRRGRAST
ncbi:MAG: DUF5318 family protein [Actinomycetota bacterium]